LVGFLFHAGPSFLLAARYMPIARLWTETIVYSGVHSPASRQPVARFWTETLVYSGVHSPATWPSIARFWTETLVYSGVYRPATRQLKVTYISNGSHSP
jgi:hypothetical protein